MNGIVLDPSDFTATNGTSVVLASGAAANDIVNIYAFQSFTVADTVSASAGGTFSANVAVTGDLTVDTNTLHVDAANNRVGVGTASPSHPLHVAQSRGGDVVALIENTNTTSGFGLKIKAGGTDADRYSLRVDSQAGTELFRVRTEGGVAFNGDTAAANALDDYEEGTWNPGVGGTATYDHQRGTYTKIGNIVSVSFDISINSIGTGSTTTMSGFPFAGSTDVASLSYTGSVSYFAGLNSSNVFLGLYVKNGLSECLFVGGVSSATTISNNGMALFRNGARVVGSVTYRTA
jgi:hypothetical protein